jgi:hypothetical protein
MKTNLLIWLWYAMIAAFTGCMFVACRTVRDTKAVNRVLANRTLLDKVGPEWANFNPCVPTTPTVLPGKVVTVVDSSYGEASINELNHIIDSLLTVHCPEPVGFNIDSFRTMVSNEIRKTYKPRTIFQTRVDTMREPDPRLINIEKEKEQKLQDQLNQKIAENASLQSKLTKANWRFWGLVALISILIGLKIYMPKIPKL